MKYLSLLGLILIGGCASVNPLGELKPPQVESYRSINNYELAIISGGNTVQSAVVSNKSGSTGSTDPNAIIAGVLLKKGVTRIYKAPDDNKNKVLLVTWVISGTRPIGLLGAYAQEITILMRQLDDKYLAYMCTAEGIGANKADDVREAAFSCLSGL
jgi:hypothetical protein